jgi:hypothetical protein
MDKDEAVRRLIFIKYLYESGAEQSKKPAPYSSTTVLMFHDTVELFLVLVAEFLDISEKTLKDLSFTKSWSIIDPALERKGKGCLTQRLAMERLNDARNVFKHRGIMPSEDIVNSTRISVGDFLEENTKAVLAVDFREISLVDFVYFKSAQNSLKGAIGLLKENKKEEAIDKIALSFRQLLDDYIDRKRVLKHGSLFSFSDFSGFSSSEDNMDDVEWAFNEVEDALDSLEEPVRLLALGLDYRKYVRFDLITSRRISRDREKRNYVIDRLDRKIDGNPNDNDLQFCINFVIESAIILKQFDFELRPAKPKT